MKVIISAAGTAGHINPALAIANKIKEEDKDSEILFIGTDYGLENELVTKAGYNLKRINAYGFSKKITFENFKRIFQTITSIFKMKKIIKEFGADIVIGTGGYICGPTFYAADSLKIPMLLHESNGYPGMAVKMFDGKVDKILLGFDNAKEYLKHKENTMFVGNPTSIRKVDITIERKKDGVLVPKLNGETLKGVKNVKVNYSYGTKSEERTELVEIIFLNSEIEIIDIE